MATNRTPLKRRNRRRITPAAIEAFKAGDDRALFRALGLPPWHISPLDSRIYEAKPAYLEASNLCSAPTWEVAVELRRELEQAAEEK